MASSKSSEDRLRKLLNRLRSLHLLRNPPDCELTHSQIGMLAWITRSPGCGVLEIASALGLTAPTVSVGIQRLTKDGWLERRQDPDDRRAKPIYLTDKSAVFMKALRAHQARTLKYFLSGLNQSEQKQFLLLFESAVSNMEQNTFETL
ncbi:MAG: MarR family transcriptional regulator [Chloroflexi bacterium]|nr:MarR family transcriptional regulator [Chloroflexota bacterium]